MIALGLLLHKTNAQSQLSMGQFYYMGGGIALNPTPIVSFQKNNGFYTEARYNYEDVNTFSYYMGKTFAKEANFSYSISPMAGAVIGNFNGGSLAANIGLGYKDFYLFSQPQYTFSLQNSIDNYIYHWTDLTYSPLDWLSVGVSVQHTKPHYDKSTLEKGIVAELAYKKWTFPLYVFNPHVADRYFVLGANLELSFKKRKKNSRINADLTMPTPESLVELPKENIVTEPEKKPEILAKVRRVTVAVNNKINDEAITNEISANPTPPTQSKAEHIKTASKINSTPTKIPSLTKTPQTDIKKSATTNNATARIDDQKPNVTKRLESVERSALDKPVLPIVNSTENAKNLFAVILSPFKNEQDALFIKSKLTVIFKCESSVYSDGGDFKIRIPNFTHQTEAEIFINRCINSGFKNTFAVSSYQSIPNNKVLINQVKH